METDAYLYGQILGTHTFRLKGGFLRPDEYSEIAQKTFLPGGETGTAATVLASLGVRVKIDGTHIGAAVADMLKDFYRNRTVDLSSLTFDPSYEGLMDYVVVADLVRSPMGFFQQLYEQGIRRWNIPREEDVRDCRVAAIDPFFMDETQRVAELCVRYGKPYVTIDCGHDAWLHRHAAINVVSKECLGNHYAGMEREDVFRMLTETTDGLVIITSGEKDMLWGRKDGPMHRTRPFDTEVRSTLGAGDTFKAGCVYALLKGMTDAETVRFAAACSAVAISRFPLPLYPPEPDEVRAVLERQNGM